MDANIYRLFRFIINDTVSPYSMVDFLALKYLDKAIDLASDILDYTFKESKTISSSDILNGYFELSREIVSFKSGMLGNRGTIWNYGGGKKIRMIDSTAFRAGDTFEFFYKAKYVKFDGVVKDQLSMDLPTEAEIGVVLIALGLYMQGKGVVNADGDYQVIKSKSEESLQVSYAIGEIFNEISRPQDFIDRGADILRDLPIAESMFFSIKS